nr:YXWGXW repeat-containing protein [Burkholderia plantarii]
MRLRGPALRLLCACVVEPARPPQPAPRVEVMPAPPAPGYRWVKGHYRWEGNHWAWVPGHWVAAY